MECLSLPRLLFDISLRLFYATPLAKFTEEGNIAPPGNYAVLSSDYYD